MREKMRKIVWGLIGPIMNVLRRAYYSKLRKRLTNINPPPSIIASDCIGGLISHNLGMQFRSPTINLCFSKEDFILFCENLPDFLNAELIEDVNAQRNFPVGILQYHNLSIKLYFLHYHSFDAAKQKWEKRKQRVDFSNIIILWVIHSSLTKEDVNRFDKLPYKRKWLISYKNPTNSKNVVINRVFQSKDFVPGKILHYPSIFSVKRYMDEMDYVSLINEEP